MDHVIDYAEDKSKTQNLEFKNNYEIWVNDLRDVILQKAELLISELS